MAPQTRKLTIQMAHQDGTPFAGYASVRLSSASKTDEELVGPLVWQESGFDAEGKVELDLVPTSALGEGTCYRCQIYAAKTANGLRLKARVVDTAFEMPDADSLLHDLAVVEPVSMSALDAMQALLSEARQDFSGKLDAAASLADEEIDSIFEEE